MKYKLLAIVYPKIGGCQYYRQIHPHEGFKKYDDFEIIFKNGFEFIPIEEFLKYNLVIFHKNFVTPEILKKLKVLGVKTMVDFDDFWYLPYNHLSYRHYKKNNQPQRFIQILRQADYVSTTTKLLAQEIKKYNMNVFVFPNAISKENTYAYPIEIPSPCIRFGYVGGACHLPDVELLRGLNNKLNNSGLEYSLNLFGYKEEGAYFDYAKILTSNGAFSKNLTLYPSLPVPDYLTFYNLFDVSLVPLVANKFNSMKSELKLVEAAMFNLPVIVSNVFPYKPYLKHKKNCLVAECKNDWFKSVRYLVKNPEAITQYGKQLNDDIIKHFNYELISDYRAQVYKEIIQRG